MQAIIHLMPSSLRREFIFLEENKVPALVEQFDAGKYEKTGTAIPVYVDSHEGAASEMFDLTNNPGRQDERERLYGCHRSVSVGDIIQVIPPAGSGHSYWLCMSFGWKELT